MIRLDAATVLLQWATGGMVWCWSTTRRRQVGSGYGWLLRSTYLVVAVLALVVGLRFDAVAVRELSSAATAVGCGVALLVSITRRGANRGPEFPPWLDLVPVAAGTVGLVAAALDAGGAPIVALLRTLAGAAFLGAVTDAMLLGHWYLVQPGLPRGLLHELIDALGWVWPLEVGALLLPTGMVSVWVGTVDDGWGGVLGWFWAACAVTTIVLVKVTKAALREREYSAVMAATGLLYLAILTAFGTDLVARAVLAT